MIESRTNFNQLIKTFRYFLCVFCVILLVLLSCKKYPHITKVETTGVTTQNNSVVLNGEILDIEDRGILDYGFCISSHSTPALTDTVVSLGQKSDKGKFLKSVSSVSINRKYYVRAFTKGDLEIKYGKELIFLIPTILNADVLSRTVDRLMDSCTVNIVSNQSWSAVSNQSWLTCTPNGTGNASMTISYLDNNSASSRTASITVSSSGAASLAINIIQKGYSITILPSSQNVSSTSGTANFTITSNINWTTSSNQTWCAVSPTSGTLNGSIIATYLANLVTSTRIATITLIGAGVPNQTVTVTQDAFVPTLNISPTNQNVSSAIGTTAINVTSNINWSASSNQTWCTIAPISGSNNGTVTVNYSANPLTTDRSAVITFSGSGVTAQTFTLDQTGVSTPTITTSLVTNVSFSSATCGGNVSNDGGASITARGVCWSTTSNPTISNSNTTDGTGIGNFSSSITSLVSNTIYYVRAYATNSAGTSYGAQISFTTTQNLTIPTVTTTATSNVTQTLATSGGNITNDGGASITARGVCWSASPNPTISNSLTSDGTGTGSFSSSITSLLANTTYYIRAYATNSIGTSYGAQISFTTTQNITIPTVTTTSASSITSNSAISGGNVTNDGGASVTARGVCWSTSSAPTISNSLTTNGTGTGSFSSSITSLISNTTYHVRAYATNSAGTAYGAEINFITSVAIGDTYQGGIVAYILQTGDPGYIAGQTHGFVAASSDQSSGASWGCGGTTISGATGTTVGTGQANTTYIVGGCTTAGIAAQLCNDLVLNGYSDWFLPSEDELLHLVQYLNCSCSYWSSSQSSSINAANDAINVEWFGSSGAGYDAAKNTNYSVRAIRTF